jgi:hypothetical protein
MTGPRDSAHAYYEISSPFRGYFRVGRALIIEPEAFFRAVRGGSLWGPAQFVFATYLLVLLIFAPFFLPWAIFSISRRPPAPSSRSATAPVAL